MTIGAFSMIFDDKHRILLCKRNDKDIWNLPGGMVEKNEAPWEAAIREAKEEIGVDIIIESLSGVFFKKEKDDLVFNFVASISNGVPTVSEEAKEIAYFSVNDIPTNTSPKQLERIKLYFDNSAVFRIQNQ
jgi:ADP-ribose pyrophosphatase YjhB (NUDIX family)